MEKMTLNDYQDKAKTFCLPECDNITYAILGLAEEVGELQGKLAKAVRKGNISINNNCLMMSYGFDGNAFKEELKRELGDVLWFVAHTSSQLGFSLEDVAKNNIAKLSERKKKNEIITHQDH